MSQREDDEIAKDVPKTPTTDLGSEIENQLDAAFARPESSNNVYVGALVQTIGHSARAICLALRRIEDMIYDIDQAQQLDRRG